MKGASMLASSLTSRPARIDRLEQVVRQDEEAQSRLERAAVRHDLKGRGWSMVGRRLHATRPILGALRLKRRQLITARWRATEQSAELAAGRTLGDRPAAPEHEMLAKVSAGDGTTWRSSASALPRR